MAESCSTKFPAGKSNKETPHTVSKKKPRTPFQTGVRGLYILGIYTFFAARNKFGGAGKRFSLSSTANPASVTDRSSERIVSNAT